LYHNNFRLILRNGKPLFNRERDSPHFSPSQVDEKMFSAMRWRQVGHFRGGRVMAVTGVTGEPNVFYFGAASGGVSPANAAVISYGL
jgi:hypothetical protein